MPLIIILFWNTDIFLLLYLYYCTKILYAALRKDQLNFNTTKIGDKGAEIMNTYFSLFLWFDCNPQKSFNIFFHTCNMYSACVCNHKIYSTKFLEHSFHETWMKSHEI